MLSKKCKKASLMDLLFILLIVFGFALSILIGFKVMDGINSKIQVMPGLPVESQTATNTLNNHFPGVIDNSVLLVLVFGSIAILILASMVRIHPIFIPIFLIGLVILIFFAGIMSNIYEAMATNASLASTASQLTITNKIMLNLPKIAGIIGFILMIVMYKSWSNDQ